MKQFHAALGLLITLKCPLECAHCSVDSGPKRSEILDRDLIVHRLRELGREGKVKQLILTGGEPFAVPGLFAAILDVAAESCLRVMANTSAYWVTSLEKASATLRRFPGITQLCVSADEYHAPFVPLQNIKNALLAAMECGIVPELSIRVWDTTADPFLEGLYSLLGEDLIEISFIDLERIVPVGRASALPVPSGARQPQIVGFPEGACDVAHQPSVDHDGKVLACCNTLLARKNDPLQLGDLRKQSFSDISRGAEHNNLLHALRLWGPRRLAEIVMEEGLGDRLKSSHQQGNICSLCDDLLSQTDLVNLLESVLEGPEMQEEIVLGRLLRYGEMPLTGSRESGLPSQNGGGTSEEA